jgi:uncharacterized membrane protein
MDGVSWAKVHGAVVHFPVALSLCSAALDAAGFASWPRPVARELHRGGRVAMFAGTLGSIPVVVSGLMMTRGEVLGHGLMRWHHLFAWPAFGLLVALATWRGLAGSEPPRRAMACYLGCAVLAAGLVSAAGYWGGEMLIRG